jgi:hypothetical protein
MKKIIKYSNHFGLVLALCTMAISGCSSTTTKLDPLAGWKAVGSQDPNSMISKDYQDYIQKLPPEERNYVGPVFYLEDGTGQHAVTFEVDKYGKDVWNYYLFYDKDNKRIKAIKYYRGRYWNP